MFIQVQQATPDDTVLNADPRVGRSGSGCGVPDTDRVGAVDAHRAGAARTADRLRRSHCRTSTDDEGRLSISVPSTWTDTDVGPQLNDDATDRPRVAAAPVLDEFYSDWEAPGRPGRRLSVHRRSVDAAAQPRVRRSVHRRRCPVVQQRHVHRADADVGVLRRHGLAQRAARRQPRRSVGDGVRRDPAPGPGQHPTAGRVVIVAGRMSRRSSAAITALGCGVGRRARHSGPPSPPRCRTNRRRRPRDTGRPSTLGFPDDFVLPSGYTMLVDSTGHLTVAVPGHVGRHRPRTGHRGRRRGPADQRRHRPRRLAGDVRRTRRAVCRLPVHRRRGGAVSGPLRAAIRMRRARRSCRTTTGRSSASGGGSPSAACHARRSSTSSSPARRARTSRWSSSSNSSAHRTAAARHRAAVVQLHAHGELAGHDDDCARHDDVVIDDDRRRRSRPRPASSSPVETTHLENNTGRALGQCAEWMGRRRHDRWRQRRRYVSADDRRRAGPRGLRRRVRRPWACGSCASAGHRPDRRHRERPETRRLRVRRGDTVRQRPVHRAEPGLGRLRRRHDGRRARRGPPRRRVVHPLRPGPGRGWSAG